MYVSFEYYDLLAQVRTNMEKGNLKIKSVTCLKNSFFLDKLHCYNLHNSKKTHHAPLILRINLPKIKINRKFED